MNKRIFTSFLIVLFLSSCAEADLPPTPTPNPTSTPIPSPTFTATPTEDPLAGAPEGTTGKNSKGEWTKTVIGNGITYDYTYNVELGQWVREVANFPLLDYPYNNFLPYIILITENVKGEQSLYAMSHKDDTPGYGLNSTGTYDPTPIKAVISIPIRKRYFIEDSRQLSDIEKQEVIYDEMLGKGNGEHRQAYLPIIISNGEEKKVKLSQDTGIILTIMDKDTIFKLGEDRVSEWSYRGVQFYSDVYDVDKNGNMLVRLAVDGSWNDNILWEETDQMWLGETITEAVMRVAFFTIPANFVEHKDQREQGPSIFSELLTLHSNWLQVDGKTKDLEIERAPAVQP